MKEILIRNARIYDHEASRFSAPQDMRITNGVIAEMADHIEGKPGDEVVEGADLCVSAGWTDCHTHLEGFDPLLTYPSLGVTRVHDAGSMGALGYPKVHDIISRMPYPMTTYLYVGVHGIGKKELQELSYIQEEPFLETARAHREQILGAKIRVDPRVNCDTHKTLVMAKKLAEKAELPLIVHPSRTDDSLEAILSVLEKGDVYTHIYSPVAPPLFDENGKVKQVAWEAMKRGVRFDLAHGSNNFGYELARRAIKQGFLAETISTDMHIRNYERPGMDLAGVMTKAVQAGYKVEQALNAVINAPLALLGLDERKTAPAVGQRADLTVFRLSETPVDLPDSIGEVETCHMLIEDAATVIGETLNRSIETAARSENYL